MNNKDKVPQVDHSLSAAHALIMRYELLEMRILELEAELARYKKKNARQ